MIDEKAKMIKKTVVLHPIMDSYIRKTWAILIDNGHDASYSTALNWMLLATIIEASKEGHLSEETIETVQSFMDDQGTIMDLNLQDHLANLRDFWGINR
jgi:hypothetical protein